MPHPHILLCPGAIQTHKFKLKTIFHVNTTQYLKNKIKNTIFLSKTQYLSSFFG